jgi:hypothetical protein
MPFETDVQTPTPKIVHHPTLVMNYFLFWKIYLALLPNDCMDGFILYSWCHNPYFVLFGKNDSTSKYISYNVHCEIPVTVSKRNAIILVRCIELLPLLYTTIIAQQFLAMDVE